MRLKYPVPVFAILILFTCALQAERINGSSIVTHSPFLPAEFTPPGGAGSEAGVPASTSQFQFKGVYQLDGEFYFHLHDEGSQRGKWIARNSHVSGYPRVIQFLESQNVLVVEINGERMQLAMAAPDGNTVAMLDDNSTIRSVSDSRQSVGTVMGSSSVRRPVIRSTGTTDSSPAIRRVVFSPQPRIN